MQVTSQSSLIDFSHASFHALSARIGYVIRASAVGTPIQEAKQKGNPLSTNEKLGGVIPAVQSKVTK